MAGNKSGVILDIPAMCELAVSAKGFQEEVNSYLDKIKALINELHGDGIDGLSGGQGDDINAALDSITQMADEIKKICAQINYIASKKADAMNEQYKDHGGADQKAKAEQAKNAIKRT